MTPTSKTIRCAVIGNPIAHSRSPEIHTAFAAQFGLDVHYDRILADKNDFTDHVRGFFSQGGKGLNITVPFKEKAFAMADILSTTAQLAGAVNTLWVENNQLHGCNTDGTGLVNDLRRLDFDPSGKRILVIGSGGATKGVLLPLAAAGASKLHVVNRTAVRATSLVDHLISHQPQYRNVISAAGLDAVTGTWDIVINATSSSLEHQHPLPAEYQALLNFSDHSLAYDMLYQDQPTVFMQQSRNQEQGASHMADGLGMLVGQAAHSFQIWHGLLPDTEPVLTALRHEKT